MSLLSCWTCDSSDQSWGWLWNGGFRLLYWKQVGADNQHLWPNPESLLCTTAFLSSAPANSLIKRGLKEAHQAFECWFQTLKRWYHYRNWHLLWSVERPAQTRRNLQEQIKCPRNQQGSERSCQELRQCHLCCAQSPSISLYSSMAWVHLQDKHFPCKPDIHDRTYHELLLLVRFSFLWSYTVQNKCSI